MFHKNWPKNRVLGPFSNFLAMFLYFPREGLGSPKPLFFPFFSLDFGPEARNLVCTRPTLISRRMKGFYRQMLRPLHLGRHQGKLKANTTGKWRWGEIEKF